MNPGLSNQEPVLPTGQNGGEGEAAHWEERVRGHFSVVSPCGLAVSLPRGVTARPVTASARGRPPMAASRAEEVAMGAGRASRGSGRGRGRASGWGSGVILGPRWVWGCWCRSGEAPRGAAPRAGRKLPGGAASPPPPRRPHLPPPRCFFLFCFLSAFPAVFLLPSPVAYFYFSLLTGYVRARSQTLSLEGLCTALVTKELTLTGLCAVEGGEGGSPGCPALPASGPLHFPWLPPATQLLWLPSWGSFSSSGCHLRCSLRPALTRGPAPCYCPSELLPQTDSLVCVLVCFLSQKR